MHNHPNTNSKPEAVESLVMSALKWDDLRYVLIVSRVGSFTLAASMLGVQYSTVMRRINAIEDALQARLFERLRNGYVVTPAGEELCRIAKQCESLIGEGERRIMGTDAQLRGRVQLTTAFVLAQHLLPPALAAFCAAYPDIEVEVCSSRERVDLLQRQADVALRLSPQAPDWAVGRNLGEARFRIYGWHGMPAVAKLARNRAIYPVEKLAQELPWISFERDASYRTYDHWLRANVPAHSIAARTDVFPSLLALLRVGLGVALLPEFVANSVEGIVALSAPIKELQSPVWLLTHPDLRHTARIRAFMRIVGDEISKSLASDSN